MARSRREAQGCRRMRQTARDRGRVEPAKPPWYRDLGSGACIAKKWGGAAFVGALLLAACGGGAGPAGPAGSAAAVRVHSFRGPEPGACSWFGDARDGVLYFGISAFWNAEREAGGDPRADLRVSAPRWLGRFSLAQEKALPPLVLAKEAPGGVWDVLARPDGRVFFTTYFDAMGAVDVATGHVERFPAAGAGLNELAPGPGDSVLVSRYGLGANARGGVVVLGPDGAVRREIPLEAEPGRRPAAKSLGYDPVRQEIWVNTDLLDAEGREVGHDARVLTWDGHEVARFEHPELEFMAFAPDGRAALAEVEAGRLSLRVRPAGDAESPQEAPAVLLDDAFPSAWDFVQEVRIDGGWIVATRWSGRVHLVGPDGALRTVTLPRSDDELYYTGVLRRGRLCATRCGGLAVSCRDLAEP